MGFSWCGLVGWFLDFLRLVWVAWLFVAVDSGLGWLARLLWLGGEMVGVGLGDLFVGVASGSLWVMAIWRGLFVVWVCGFSGGFDVASDFRWLAV